MFERYEKVDLDDPTVRNYTMLYEEGSTEGEDKQVKDFLKKENLKPMRMGNTYFLKMTNKQFDSLRRMRGVAGCGLEQRAGTASA
jgi:hypothetical protein